MTKLNIINWENVLAHSKTFQDQKPTKWAFIEEFFVRGFYEKLYETYPKKDESWTLDDQHDYYNFSKFWGGKHSGDISTDIEDTSFSESWNQLHHYLFSDEFISNVRKFSGVPINRLRYFTFAFKPKGGYQLAHIHNAGPSSLILVVYFNKNWEKGDPGGTYISTEEDESKMIFEPYNLDNTAMIFHDGPHAAHGSRYITKDVERRAVQIYLEKYSPDTGWSGDPKERKLREI
jgi:hypothetical protein